MWRKIAAITLFFMIMSISLPGYSMPDMKPKKIIGAKEVVVFLDSTKYLRNGKLINSSSKPIVVDEEVYVAADLFTESFQAELTVEQNRTTTIEKVILTTENKKLTLSIDDDLIKIEADNGILTDYQAVSPLIIKEGQVFLSFRAVAEAFEAKVDSNINNINIGDDNEIQPKIKWFRFIQ